MCPIIRLGSLDVVLTCSSRCLVARWVLASKDFCNFACKMFRVEAPLFAILLDVGENCHSASSRGGRASGYVYYVELFHGVFLARLFDFIFVNTCNG